MKKVFPLLVLVAVMIIAVGVVLAAPPGSGWKSGQTVQNVGGSNATVQLTAYDQNGGPFNCGSANVAPGASVNYLTDTDCPVPAGFVGSAVVSADQPIAAVVNVTNKGTGLASGNYQGTDGADVATKVNFPLVKNDHNGRTTTFYVQNASQSPNNISAVFNVKGVNYTKSFNNVPANAMVIFSPTDTSPSMPSGKGNVGSLVVTGTGPLAGSSLEHQTSAPVGDNLQASKGFTASEGANTVYCPLYRYAHTSKNQTTGAQVQNIGNAAVNVAFTVNANSGGSFGPYNANIAPGASHTFYAPDLAGLPPGTLGSATIVSNGPVVALVNDKGTSNGLERTTSYACFGSGGTTVNLPQAKEHKGGNTSGIQAQNVGNADTKVTIVYKSTNGKSLTIQSKSTIAPGTSINAVNLYKMPNADWAVISGAPASNMLDTLNGVVVTGTSPLAVVANEASNGDVSTASNQDTKNYEGFN